MVSRSLTVAIVCLSATASVSAADAQTRGVVELFTSQGCSSCPPADKLVGELALDPSLVSLSLPIDYWDYLGWKDTLADPRNTARQKAYSKVRGDREVYTPQVVVNGSLHALGSDRGAIEGAVAKSRHGAVLSLPVRLSVAGDHLAVAIAGGSEPSSTAEVWICGVAKAVTVLIKRGENQGKTITYHNVARHWVKLDVWNGSERTWTVPLRDFGGDGIDGAAVMVQTGTMEKPSAILGAAFASLH